MEFGSVDFDALAERWEHEAKLRQAGCGNGPKFEAERHARAFRQAAVLQRDEERRQAAYELREKREIAQIA